MQNLSVPLVLTFRKEFDRNILGRWKESFQVDFRTYATSFLWNSFAFVAKGMEKGTFE